MRYVYIALIVAFTALVLAFKIQNFDTVTVSLFSMSAVLPVSMLMLLVYVLGMLSGGFLMKVLRGWVQGATER